MKITDHRHWFKQVVSGAFRAIVVLFWFFCTFIILDALYELYLAHGVMGLVTLVVGLLASSMIIMLAAFTWQWSTK